jgi:co-chaperonin GroES (HSP10)
MKTRLTMFGEYALVMALSDTQSKTILIPDAVREREKPVMGKVVEVGPVFRTDATIQEFGSVKEGDVVVFPEYAGVKIKIGGMTGYMLSMRDIRGRIDDIEDNSIVQPTPEQSKQAHEMARAAHACVEKSL